VYSSGTHTVEFVTSQRRESVFNFSIAAFSDLLAVQKRDSRGTHKRALEVRYEEVHDQ
jgi:hypothetical protein